VSYLGQVPNFIQNGAL